MAEFQIKSIDAIPAFNTLTALQAWLRPGLLAYIVGSHAEALKPHATRLFQEREAMLDESALKYPENYPDAEPDEAKRGQPHPRAGQRIVQEVGNGAQIVLFKTAEAGAEFKERESAVMAQPITLRVDMRITLDSIKQIDRERLDTPRSLNGMSSDGTVDFAALMPLIERSYTSDGVAASVPSTSTKGDA